MVRRWNAAYNERDFDTLLRLTDPNIEFGSIFVGIESTFRGHDDLRTYFEQIDDAYDRFQVVPERFVDAGAAVLLVTRAEWRGKGSGAGGTCPCSSRFGSRPAWSSISTRTPSAKRGLKPWGCRSKTLTPTARHTGLGSARRSGQSNST